MKPTLIMLMALAIFQSCSEAPDNYQFKVATVSPAHSYYPGGAEITLVGLGFKDGMQVKIGENDCTSIEVQSANVLTCLVPEGTAGSTVDITVSTEIHTSLLTAAFTYRDFSRISTMAGTGIAGSANGTGNVATLSSSINGFAFDSTLDKFVFADGANSKVRLLNASDWNHDSPSSTHTVVSDLAGSGARGNANSSDGTGNTATFTSPDDITITGSFIYLLDTFWSTLPYSSLIRKIDRSTGETTTMLSGVNGYGSIRWDGGSFIYASNCNDHTIKKIDMSTWTVSTVAGAANTSGSTDAMGSSARFNCPFGLAFDDNKENLYIADYYNNKIRKMNITSLAVTTIAGSGAAGSVNHATGTSATFSSPSKLTVAGNYVFVTDHDNCLVRALNLTTTAVTTLAGTTCGVSDGVLATAQMRQPNGITYHPTLGILVGASDWEWEAGGAEKRIRLVH